MNHGHKTSEKEKKRCCMTDTRLSLPCWNSPELMIDIARSGCCILSNCKLKIVRVELGEIENRRNRWLGAHVLLKLVGQSPIFGSQCSQTSLNGINIA